MKYLNYTDHLLGRFVGDLIMDWDKQQWCSLELFGAQSRFRHDGANYRFAVRSAAGKAFECVVLSSVEEDSEAHEVCLRRAQDRVKALMVRVIEAAKDQPVEAAQ